MIQLDRALERRRQMGNDRRLIQVGQLIDFASNDYLGLARSQRLKDAVLTQLQQQIMGFNGYGSTGSRLLTGNTEYAENLESDIAKFHGYGSGTLFGCGYMANLGLITAIANEEALILFDTAVHASIRDGIKLSRAHAYPFRHHDLVSLEDRLKASSSKLSRFVCVESIYSTDGSKAPLIEICQLMKKYNARLIVDEAHAVGICGPQGRGLVAEYGLTEEVFAQVVTFGKALGTYGAIVLGNQQLKNVLINFAHSFIYTTAPPLHNLIAIRCSYDLFPGMEEERQHLQRLVHLLGRSQTHIQPVYVRGNQQVKELSCLLAERGLDVRALLSPTVQRGQEMLRVCLHASNSEAELEQLMRCL